MTGKPVRLRASAIQDVEESVDHYRREAGERIAAAFADEIERAFTAIARSPAAGSPRYAHDLDLPGLRHRQLRRFPYLVFYVEKTDAIEVWRVLHGGRDIPHWMPGASTP